VAPVYSVRLINLHGGGSQVFNAPPGVRVITRFFTGFNANALTNATFNLSISGPDVTFLQQDIPPQASVYGDLRVVVEYPEEILCSADMGVDVTLYGYQLTLP